MEIIIILRGVRNGRQTSVKRLSSTDGMFDASVEFVLTCREASNSEIVFPLTFEVASRKRTLYNGLLVKNSKYEFR
jgi:hypothetical protein